MKTRIQKAPPLFCLRAKRIIKYAKFKHHNPLTFARSAQKYYGRKLCSITEIDAGSFVLLSHLLTSVPRSIINKKATSFEKYRHKIVGVIDLLLKGI